ncbi:MAG: hypothetical protein RIC19_07245 [Phaeodactylibacter sp.]|uniref:hypothetical protein n=1 Tax=Phaeodactylibacter sp. TaxID=1940289 RepID=UPI0032EC498E
MQRHLYLFALLWVSAGLWAQMPDLRFFKDVEMRIDTSVFRWTAHQLQWQSDSYLGFEYREETPTVEFRFYPIGRSVIENVTLLPSGDFELIDSLRLVNEEYYRLKIRFKPITNLDFLQLSMEIVSIYSRQPYLLEFRMFPTTRTRVSFESAVDELFIGEERVFKLQTGNLDNIRPQPNWIRGGEIPYRITKDKGKLMLHLLPDAVGIKTLQATLETRKPYLDSTRTPRYTLPPLERDFTVKPAKLGFLKVEPGRMVLGDDNRGKGIEVELDYDAGLELEKTYRLEAQERPGGALVAELFTRNILGNGKLLCWLRLYGHHRRNQGYLYIKDGDQAKFITNMDIMPEMQIDRLSLQREGQNWQSGNQIYPGERIGIRIEGQELDRGDFSFEGLKQVEKDTLTSTAETQVFWARVPIDIIQQKVQVFNHDKPTGQSLNIREYDRPRVLDFITLRYGEQKIGLNEADKLLFVEENMDDILLAFRPERIDSGLLHGPQYLKAEVEIRDQRNQLVDQRELPGFVVCPAPESPRASFYKQQQCQTFDMSLNKYLRKKIYDLDLWSTIRVKISHDEDHYGKSKGFSQTSEFVLYRRSSFDIDVSFPAGLVIKRLSEPGFGNLGGISMAMIAQFSFYKDKKINKPKPYKFGAGFLAFNAFNFSENNTNRDVGLVGLVSLYPIKTKYSSRLSFPLFAGGGYFLSEQKWFLLFGPGIRVRL